MAAVHRGFAAWVRSLLDGELRQVFLPLEAALTLDDAVARVQAIHDAAVAVNPEVLLLCHGGPIAEPEDAAAVLSRTSGIAGFFGASSIERLPTERAITEQVKQFKSIAVRPPIASGTVSAPA